MIIESILIGVVAGVVAGLLGVGGGILFVPALIWIADLNQVNAEATSLLAILPASIIGTWRQYKYGNLRFKAAMLIGVLSIVGVFAGVFAANALPGHILKLAFAGLLAVVAIQVARKAMR